MFSQTIKDTYTVESVTSGHPDKVCDQISDSILDALLEKDPKSRVAVEAFGSHGLLVIGGEVSSTATVNYAEIAERVYESIGYTDSLEIITRVETQAPEIAIGVNTGGAGDQGIMYGFATNETKEFLPKGVVFAHALAQKLEEARKEGAISWLMPDGKTQVTIENGKVSAIVVSAQHKPEISETEINSTIREKIISPILGNEVPETIFINPTGSFITGGFASDAGLTGRKIMVDTYGGLAPHGGGAFSGKDATKVDRSAAYMARFAAKNLVAAGYGTRVLVSVSYAIGRAEPVQVTAYTEEGVDLRDVVKKHFDFRPQAIIERLGLTRPVFKQTAAYGHFGKADLPWEKIISLA